MCNISTEKIELYLDIKDSIEICVYDLYRKCRLIHMCIMYRHVEHVDYVDMRV